MCGGSPAVRPRVPRVRGPGPFFGGIRGGPCAGGSGVPGRRWGWAFGAVWRWGGRSGTGRFTALRRRRSWGLRSNRSASGGRPRLGGSPTPLADLILPRACPADWSAVLAGEINRGADDLPTALANCDRALRPFVDGIRGGLRPPHPARGHAMDKCAVSAFQNAAALACFLRIPGPVAQSSKHDRGGGGRRAAGLALRTERRSREQPAAPSLVQVRRHTVPRGAACPSTGPQARPRDSRAGAPVSIGAGRELRPGRRRGGPGSSGP